MRIVSYDRVHENVLDSFYDNEDLIYLYGPMYLMHYTQIADKRNDIYCYDKASYLTSPFLRFCIDYTNMINLSLSCFFGDVYLANAKVHQGYGNIGTGTVLNNIIDQAKSLIYRRYSTIKSENRNIVNVYLNDIGEFYSMFVKAANLTKAHYNDIKLDSSHKDEYRRRCYDMLQNNLIRLYQHFDESKRGIKDETNGNQYVNMCQEYLARIQDGRLALLANIRRLFVNHMYEIFVNYHMFITDDDKGNAEPYDKGFIPREFMRLRNCKVNEKNALLYYTLVYTYLTTETDTELNQFRDAISEYNNVSQINNFNFDNALEAVMRFDMPNEKIIDKMMKNLNQ